ncbi:MAG: isocitrate dehydrogenase, partial [Chloroflexota bacterium]
MKTYPVVELLGDGISSELSESVHRVAETLPFDLVFEQVDLSLENRNRLGGELYDQAVEAVER